MNEDLKIYTAAEVQSVGYSKEQIEQSAAKLTQEAYEAAKTGAGRIIHSGYNLNLLKEIGMCLSELGYDTQLSERELGPSYIIIRWGTY